MTPAGFRVDDRTCMGCDAHHVTVWWTIRNGGFWAYCAGCWAYWVGVFKP